MRGRFRGRERGGTAGRHAAPAQPLDIGGADHAEVREERASAERPKRLRRLARDDAQVAAALVDPQEQIGLGLDREHRRQAGAADRVDAGEPDRVVPVGGDGVLPPPRARARSWPWALIVSSSSGYPRGRAKAIST